MRRFLFTLAIALCSSLMTACAGWRVDKAAQVASGTTSHWLCYSVFISGQDADRSFDELLRPMPGMALVNWGLRYEVDRDKREVRSSIAGGFKSRAVYRDQLGCALAEDGVTLPAAPPPAPWVEATQPDPAAQPAPPLSPALSAALDRVFTPPAGEPDHHTKAVVVLRDGRLIAERYAPGITQQTPLHGFSMTKSVTNALLGILVRQGKLRMDQPVPGAWPDAKDPRHAITVEHLLRQVSGLDLPQQNSGFDASSQILYSAPDKAAATIAGQLAATPGTHWAYTDPHFLLLGRVIRDAVGGDAATLQAFLRDELFGPLGMRSAQMDIDATGTPIAAVHAYATARDWARFGQLYLDDGLAGSRRILPPGWVTAAATPTLDTGYGAGWWTNKNPGNVAQWSHGDIQVAWGFPHAPRDTFFARGFLGQFVIVIPSEHLVIVRLDASQERSARHIAVDTDRLVAEIVAALR